ncbi:MAG: hypothetical protein LBM76_02585 [Mycoplasmataceae bacterium]|nr:hypothetical protein [Mycoplasmataceae bacterium]
MIISSGVYGILIGYLFKETQENNVDLIVSTKKVTKNQTMLGKVAVYFTVSTLLTALLMVFLLILMPTMKDVTFTRFSFLLANIVVGNAILTLIFGGIGIFVSLKANKTVTVLSPMVVALALNLVSAGMSYGQLTPEQNMLINDNVQASTLRYYAKQQNATGDTTGKMSNGISFTSFNPDIQFTDPLAAQDYYANRIAPKYEKSWIGANFVKQLTFAYNSIGLQGWSEKYCENEFGYSDDASYKLQDLAYSITEEKPLMYVDNYNGADCYVYMLGNTGDNQRFLSNNIAYLYNGDARVDNKQFYTNEDLAPKTPAEKAYFSILYAEFNSHVKDNNFGAWWDIPDQNEYEFLWDYMVNIHPNPNVHNDLELNRAILEFKMYSYYKACESLNIMNIISDNYFTSGEFYNLQWRVKTFILDKTASGIHYSDGSFFANNGYGSEFSTIKLGLFSNVLFGFFTFTTSMHQIKFYMYDIYWAIVGVVLMGGALFLYKSKDFS